MGQPAINYRVLQQVAVMMHDNQLPTDNGDIQTFRYGKGCKGQAVAVLSMTERPVQGVFTPWTGLFFVFGYLPGNQTT